MNIKFLSSWLRCDILKPDHVQDIFHLCKSNPQYYVYCPPQVTVESILEDMKGLPPGKTYEDKYYIGFWDDQKLVAVMDLILYYPDKETAYIGFFMVDQCYQGKGIGSRVINDVFMNLKQSFKYVRLGFVKGNSQAEHFWLKNGFKQSGSVVSQDLYDIVVVQREL